jgi:hypothetical protein
MIVVLMVVSRLVWLECWDGWSVCSSRSNYRSGFYGRFDVALRGEEIIEV